MFEHPDDAHFQDNLMALSMGCHNRIEKGGVK
jgi:hypothetical protein